MKPGPKPKTPVPVEAVPKPWEQAWCVACEALVPRHQVGTVQQVTRIREVKSTGRERVLETWGNQTAADAPETLVHLIRGGTAWLKLERYEVCGEVRGLVVDKYGRVTVAEKQEDVPHA